MADKTNLGFLRGTQTNFDKLSSYQAGAFYLTTDTNRLYYADSANKVSYLNKYVHTVANSAALTAVIQSGEVSNGDFVYVADVNALVAIDSTATGGYKQVNAYTNTDSRIDNVAFGTEVTQDKKSINVTQTIVEGEYDVLTGGKKNTTTKTASFKINADDIAAITPTTGVDVGASVDAAGAATIKTSGVGATGDGFKVVGDGDVINITSDGADGFIIKGTNSKSTLSSKNGVITLSESTGETSKVTLEGGTEINVTEGDAVNHIKVSHATIARGADTSTGSGVVEYTKSFEVIDDVTLENGHVTKVNKKTVTLPALHEYSITAAQGTADGKIVIKLKDSTGPEQTYTSDNQSLYFLVDGQKVYNQGTLDVYTTAQIDKKFQGLNAMTYKGTVDNDIALPTTKVQIGDVYMVAAVGSYGPDNKICEIGDLWIATGTEDNDGYITAATLEWTYVPAGDDTDTHYELETTDNGINLQNTTEGKSAGSATFTGSKKVVLTKSGKNFDFSHATQSVTKTTDAANTELSHAATFTAVNDVTYDEYGHVTGFKVNKFKAVDTTYKMSTDGSGKITLTGYHGSTTSGAAQTVTFVGGDAIGVSSVAGEAGKITVSHAKLTPTVANTKTPTAAQTLIAITDLEFDAHGHVSGYGKTKFTVPSEHTYKLDGVTAEGIANGVKMTTTLTTKQDGNETGEVQKAELSVTSNSLAITAGTKGYSVELVWGSF